jgi:hypothetical protein
MCSAAAQFHMNSLTFRPLEASKQPGGAAPSHIKLAALFQKLGALFRHPFFALGHRQNFLAQILRDLHRAELRPAHRAKMRGFMRLFRQRFVMEEPRRIGIETEIELILPAEIEPRAGHSVVSDLRRRMLLGEVAGVRASCRGTIGLDAVFLRIIKQLISRSITFSSPRSAALRIKLPLAECETRIDASGWGPRRARHGVC